jgi:hypothetical protein
LLTVPQTAGPLGVSNTYIVSLVRIHFSSLVSLYRIKFLELQGFGARIGGQAGTTDGTEGRPETAAGSPATTANTTCSVPGYVVSTKVSENIKVSRFQIYLLQPQEDLERVGRRAVGLYTGDGR